MIDIKQVADNADMIINGYAFTCEKNNIRVLNLNNTSKALTFNDKDIVIETTMDDIEISIVKDNGDTVVQEKGIVNDRTIRKLQAFIKKNYKEMYKKWSEYSKEGFYRG